MERQSKTNKTCIFSYNSEKLAARFPIGIINFLSIAVTQHRVLWIIGV